MAKQWASTVKELGSLLQLSTRALYKTWLNKPGFPAKTKKGYYVKKCQEFIEYTKQMQDKTPTPETAASKKRKTDLECELIEMQLAQKRGELITIDEYRNDLEEHAAIANGVFDQWIHDVAAITRNPKLLEKAKLLRDRARKLLAKRIEEIN